MTDTFFSSTSATALDDAIRLAKSEELVIPFGIGIAGCVAETKDIVNIKDAYNDPRFNSDIDLKTGYKTNIILSMPICNYEGDVIGVAQIINKTNGETIEIDWIDESGEAYCGSMFFFLHRPGRVHRA